MKIILKNESELASVAKEILDLLGDRTLILLVGDLGAGKTTLVKYLAEELNVEANISSPTFSIINEYPVKSSADKVYHIDLYRLNSLQEALDIGIEEYLYSGNLNLIEWPQIIEPILMDNFLICKIQIQEDGGRSFELSLS